MKAHLLFATALAVSAATAVPAAAQANGIGVTEPAIAIAGSKARAAAYQQIGQTYAAQITQLQTLQTQQQTLLRPFDTDNDGQLSETEQQAMQGNASVMQQVQTLEQTMSQTNAPIQLARFYAIEQILLKYGEALQQVVTANNLQVVLTPSSYIYAAPALDVTGKIVAQLDTMVPAVSISAPAGWQPQRQTVQLTQEVQQVLIQAAQAQQAAAGQQPAPAVQGR